MGCSARDTVRDKIAGLEAGADDYVLKSFDLDELIARVRALLQIGADRIRNSRGVGSAPAAKRQRHPNRAGATGARRRGDHDDLHPCPEVGRRWCRAKSL